MSGAKLPLSACVVARDEEDNIERCLRSVAFCDDVLVVDSHSTDRTRELAAALGARVVERDWPGFGAQKNHAAQLAKHDWILSLDADEWLSPELEDQVRALVAGELERKAGWTMPRLSEYFGTWMRRGGWYPDRQLRLYDRRRGRWGGRPPHEHVETDGETGALSAPLLHRPYRSLEDHLAKIDAYTSVRARELFAAGRRARAHDLVLRPALRFLRFYVFKLGLVHGWTGLYLSYLDAHYVRLKYAKLMALQRGLPLSDERPR